MILLYHMKLERNSFSLIIKNMLDYEEDVKQEIAHIQLRNRKEKDEYIEKIVKLNNRIELLETTIDQLQLEQQQEEQDNNRTEWSI